MVDESCSGRHKSAPLMPAMENLRSALVVGAGVAGLCTARQLLRIGVQVLVLEASSEIGGVWARNYDGYGLQIPWRHYQFPEFMWPEGLRPKEEYPSGKEVQAYVQAFAAHFGLMRHVRLNCKLLRLRWCAETRQWEALFCDCTKEKFFKVKVDYAVICCGLYSHPYIPHYKGAESFAGLQIHAKDFTNMSVARGRRVVIVGAGKTALDCVGGLLVSRCAASVTLLYRQAHWPVPRSLVGVPVRRLLFSRAAAAMLPPYYTADRMDRALHAVVQPLKRLFWRGLECAISRKFKMASGKLTEPRVGLPSDLFYGGQIFDDSAGELMQCETLTAIKGEINQFVARGVILQDGSFRPADVILYCTGYVKTYDYFEYDVRERLSLQKDGLYLYRNCLPCAVPHLAFVGSEVSTYSNIVTDSLQALWLAHVLTGAVQLPTPDAMDADVRAQQRWRREVMPAQRSRGAVLMMYGMQYHDQLLRDMGQAPRRKGLNFVAECCGAYSPEDYQPLLEQIHLATVRAEHQHQQQPAQGGGGGGGAEAVVPKPKGPTLTGSGEGFARDTIDSSSCCAAVASSAPLTAALGAASREFQLGPGLLDSECGSDRGRGATVVAVALRARSQPVRPTAATQAVAAALTIGGSMAKSRSGPLPGAGASTASGGVFDEEFNALALARLLRSTPSWKMPPSPSQQDFAVRRPHQPGSRPAAVTTSPLPAVQLAGARSGNSCRLHMCTRASDAIGPAAAATPKPLTATATAYPASSRQATSVPWQASYPCGRPGNTNSRRSTLPVLHAADGHGAATAAAGDVAAGCSGGALAPSLSNNSGSSNDCSPAQVLQRQQLHKLSQQQLMQLMQHQLLRQRRAAALALVPLPGCRHGGSSLHTLYASGCVSGPADSNPADSSRSSSRTVSSRGSSSHTPASQLGSGTASCLASGLASASCAATSSALGLASGFVSASAAASAVGCGAAAGLDGSPSPGCSTCGRRYTADKGQEQQQQQHQQLGRPGDACRTRGSSPVEHSGVAELQGPPVGRGTSSPEPPKAPGFFVAAVAVTAVVPVATAAGSGSLSSSTASNAAAPSTKRLAAVALPAAGNGVFALAYGPTQPYSAPAPAGGGGAAAATSDASPDVSAGVSPRASLSSWHLQARPLGLSGLVLPGGSGERRRVPSVVMIMSDGMTLEGTAGMSGAAASLTATGSGDGGSSSSSSNNGSGGASGGSGSGGGSSSPCLQIGARHAARLASAGRNNGAPPAWPAVH